MTSPCAPRRSWPSGTDFRLRWRGYSPATWLVWTRSPSAASQIPFKQRNNNDVMLSLLAGVATVSLLVGGIGIMNILLLSVTERTREIGLRVAVGAQRSDVIMQFVGEAVVLSVVGGLLGTAVGALASGSLQRFFKYSIDISIASSLAAIAVAAVLGIIFGVYPARRAAGLDPIEALHHE